MFQKVFIVWVLVGLVSGLLQAAPEKPALYQAISTQTQSPRMQVMVKPLSLLNVNLSGEYGIKLHDRIALTFPVSAQYSPKTWFIVPISQAKFMAGMGARFFVMSSAFSSGIYVEPFVCVGYSSLGSAADYLPVPRISSFVLETGAVLGYGWVLGSGLSFNLGVKPYYSQHFGEQAKDVTSALKRMPLAQFALASAGMATGVGANIEFSMGYAW